MANYLQLKQQFNSNKTFIKQVLNDQKYMGPSYGIGLAEMLIKGQAEPTSSEAAIALHYLLSQINH